MGLFDWLPCCGPREGKQIGLPRTATTESTNLLGPPHRADSILSHEGSYGATQEHASVHGALSGEQRARIEEIGREVGGHMLNINSSSRPRRSLPLSQAGERESSSATSSRPSSPSPLRPNTSPPGGFMRTETIDTQGTTEELNSPGGSQKGTGSGDEEAGEDGDVVRKTVFLGGLQGGPPRKVSGKKGRGRGRGRGK